MARRRFGGSVSDWTFTLGTGNIPALTSGATCLFYDSQTAGSQYTDLATAADGSGPITQVVSGTGSAGGAAGQVPIFYGPDTVIAMWMSANGAPRVLIVANDVSSSLASTTVANTFAAAQTFGPVGDATAKRLLVNAETTGQTAALAEFWSGTDLGQGGVRTRGAYIDSAGQLRAVSAKSSSVPLRVAGQTGQSANLTEWTDPTGATVNAYVDSTGRVVAPNLGIQFTITLPGNLTVATGRLRVFNDSGINLTIKCVRVSVFNTPSGTDIITDFNINFVTIFTNQANRPRITIGNGSSGRVSNMDITSFPNGSAWSVDVDQIGSTAAGSDIVAQLFCV